MRYKLLFICIVAFTTCFADGNKYKISEIPVKLLTNCNAVIRVFNKEVTVESKSKMTEKVKYAVTILNDEAERFSHFAENYDKCSSLKVNAIKIYDKNGKLIKKVKQREIEDISLNPGYVLFGDNRLKAYQYISNLYPYTIEYEYEKKYTSLMSYAYWIPISSYYLSLQNAHLKIQIPSTLGINYKELNMQEKVKTTTNSESKIFEWNISNYMALKREDYSPKINYIVPNVIVTPTKFEYEGHEGDLSTWNSFGKWSYSLIKNRDILPESTINEIKNLITNTKNKKDIIKKIYKYVQNKTRYVCISLGIGGFQPFKAETVDKYCYGDCKALSNYTKALLKIADIESFYTVIGAGSRNKIIYPDFAGGNQGNHIILCVPLQQDTVWLECTSQRSPFNYLGSFTSDRYAMLVSKEGGKLVKTQCYSHNDNFKTSITNAKLLNNGNVKTQTKSTYRGLLCDEILPFFSFSEKEKKDRLLKSLEIPGQNINSYSFNIFHEGKDLRTERNLDISITNYVSISGQRVFLPLNIINKTYYNPSKYSHRKQKIVQDECYTVSDTIKWEVPVEYKVESLPRTRNLSSKYGKYKSEIKVNENKIEFIRTMSIFKGEFPPVEYNDFYNFHNKVRKSEKAQVVLIKK